MSLYYNILVYSNRPVQIGPGLTREPKIRCFRYSIRIEATNDLRIRLKTTRDKITLRMLSLRPKLKLARLNI